MVPFRLAAGLCCLVPLLGCRVERRPPTGAAGDAEAIRLVVGGLHESLTAADRGRFEALFDSAATLVWNGVASRPAGDFWGRMARWRQQAGAASMDARASRMQIRHQGDVATAWLTSTWIVAPVEGLPKSVDHRAVLLLRREAGGWRIVALVLDRLTPDPVS